MQTLSKLNDVCARTKAEWEAKGTAEALRNYIFAQGERQQWMRENTKAEVSK